MASKFLVLSIRATVILYHLCCSCVSSLTQYSPSSVSNGTNDRLSLLAFKAHITHDPFHVVSSWNDSVPYCQWPGVRCGGRQHPNRVRALLLSSNGLVGSVAPEIGNLSFLRTISLQNNGFHGEIPHQISFLFRLRYLLLHNNSFEGEIPPNISRCSNLIELNLNRNNIMGKIPAELGTLSKLQYLSFFNNRMTGQIPSSIGNISSLESLSASQNDFSGSIPDSLSLMTRVMFLGLGENKLSGTIPPAMYNLSSLNVFYVGDNQLQGSLPPNLGFKLPNLMFFLFGGNQFHGSIPVSVSNLTKLSKFDVSGNNLTGKVGIYFGGQSNLTCLALDSNHLGSGEADDLSFINSLTNCSSIRHLFLGFNWFGGVLPNSIANLSTELIRLDLSENQISGNLSVGIGNLVSLQYLVLSGNLFEGSIPNSIGRLRMLNGLYLQGNRFTGTIPSSLGNLIELVDLSLGGNHLHGKIPSSLGNCKKLLRLSLSDNGLIGIIPKEICAFFTLIELRLGGNYFSGALPLEVGLLTNLNILNVSWNMLSGEIPRSLGACTSLVHLFMEGNLFQGSIPLFFDSLRGLEDLHLSHNNFSGCIPKYLGGFMALQNLNLSYNHLEGEVPIEGVFKNLSAVSVIGNNKLCGGVPELHLPTCQSKADGMPHVLKLIVTICGCGTSLCLIFMIFFFTIHRRRKERKDTMEFLIEDHNFMISYAQLFKATDGFSSENLIGVGSFGSVYKGVLNNGEKIVAVKVLNIEQRGASKSFMAECEALKNIRHRNLVRILTCCSSVDFEGNDFKALVYEFIPGGNLESWLHPHGNSIQDEKRQLNLVQRMNIAIDMATILDYLHYHCHNQIIHCDLKPNNILLDDDLTAHLSDFGISKIISKATGRSQQQTSSIGIKGSIGYIAPEYGTGAGVSIYGDVYSYGILLLEMFTKRRPTDEMFKDNFNLHCWVEMTLNDGVMAVVDPSLLAIEEEKEATTIANNIISQRCMKDRLQECLDLVIRIGVTCSSESPWDRMAMNVVVKKLQSIRDIYLGGGHQQKEVEPL